MGIINVIFKSQLNTYRFFGFFAGIMLPFFGYIHMVNGDETDPFILRLLVGSLCIVLTIFTYCIDYFKRNFLFVIYVMSYVVMTWFIYVMYIQSFKFTYIFGLFVLLTSPSFIFEKTRALIPFLIYSTLLLLIARGSHPDFVPNEPPIIPTTILLATVGTFSFLIYLFRNSALKLQEKLELSNKALMTKNLMLNDKKEEIQQQSEEIHAQNNLLEIVNLEINDKNEAITDSIEYARSIQFAMLPSKQYLDQIFNKYFILFKPRDIVSGDFYWVNEIDNKILWATGDCTGHGVPGAFMSLISMSLLNEIVIKNKILAPEKILNILRDQLIERLDGEGDSNRKDGLDIGICVFDRESYLLQYSGAYHPLIIVREGNVLEVKGDRMPIGKHRMMVPFTMSSIQLHPKDIIYTYSDGFTDQLGGEKKKKFSKANFFKILERISGNDLLVQKVMLDNEFEKWKGSLEQLDDVVVFSVMID